MNVPRWKTWLVFIGAVISVVAFMLLIDARRAYPQSIAGQVNTRAIRCPVAVAAFQQLALSGYERLATFYMDWKPVSYVFLDPATGKTQHVHCRGVTRHPLKTQMTIAAATEG